MDSQLLLSGVIFGLSMASVYFLMSIGLSLCFGLMRVISLDQLLYYAVGAYLTYTVSTASGNVWLGVLAGVAISGTLALLVERFVFRRIYERELTFSMITSFKYTMTSTICQLIGHIGTTIAKNTTIHMQRNIWTDVFFFKSATWKFETSACISMFIS